MNHDLQRIVFDLTFSSEALHHIDAGRVRVGDAHVDLQPCGRKVVGARPLVQSVFNGIDGEFKRIPQAWIQLLVRRLVLQRTVVREVAESGTRRGAAVDDAQVKWVEVFSMRVAWPTGI